MTGEACDGGKRKMRNFRGHENLYEGVYIVSRFPSGRARVSLWSGQVADSCLLLGNLGAQRILRYFP